MAVGLERVEELHRLSLAEYHRLVETGVFDEDARVELIDGLLLRMSPKTPAHENVVEWLLEWLMGAVDRARYRVRVSSPLSLTGSEPEPDIAVIARDAPRPYHPATAVLIVEVAVSSQHRDLEVKPALYAQASVTEYWVVDLDGRRVVVHRNPGDEGYRERREAGPGDRLVAAALPLPELVVDDLLRAAR